MSNNLSLRVSILNPGSDITPLKFRGWLRGEAADIDRKTRARNAEHGVSIIRIYLPAKLVMAIGQAKLDKIFQKVVDKFGTIYRIEFRTVDAPLTLDELSQAQAEVQVAMETLLKQTE